MNRKAVVIFAALFTTAISVSVIAPAFAVSYYFSESAGAVCTVEVPGQPKFQLHAMKFDRNSYNGAEDNLWIYLFTPTGKTVPLALRSDGGPLMTDVWAGTPILLPNGYETVKSRQLQIFRIGKVVMVYWTMSITVALPPPLATALGIESFTLPPGAFILRGYGEVDTTPGVTPLPSGFTIYAEPNHYDAKGVFCCPSWRFFGSVYDATISTHTDFTISDT